MLQNTGIAESSGEVLRNEVGEVNVGSQNERHGMPYYTETRDFIL